ncbi:MAG TPA: hybrid sensor histidine kinase/response regulator [Geobacteraceae bacterium]|nr:hybrid sensor histidine kinase/response regulator [Geobacteraceae bacterium]
MNDKLRDILLRLSILPLLAVCLYTGGASSPFRYFFFPLLPLLAVHLAPNAIIQTGFVFSCVQTVLAILDRPADMRSLTRVAAEVICYLLTTWAATRIAVARVEEERRYRLAEATFQGLGNELSHRSTNLQTALDALSQAHGRLQELDRNKTGFLANIAHELRTPLSGIRSYSEILLTYDDLDSETQREFMEIIQNESIRMTNLVNELLNLVKIETGKIELAVGRVNAAGLIDECINIMKPMAVTRELTMEAVCTSGSIYVNADGEQLKQVLINLINNAIKFTQQGGVTVGVLRQGQSAEFFVADTGEGIFPEEQEKIFQEFYRVLDSVPNRPPGTGLGLPICKKIVEIHGGTITVESAIGKGSTFRFTIPLFLAGEPAFTMEPGVNPKRHHDGFRPILVVIRNTVKWMCLRKSLEDVGYKTLGALTYEKGYALAKSTPVDLIIAEITNNRDGLESLAALAHSEGTKFIMAYFHVSPPEIISLAITGYIWKPFNSYQIMPLIEPFKKKRMKFAIVSSDMDESRMLQMILGTEGHTTSLFGTVDSLIQSTASISPDAAILGSFEEELLDTIVGRIKANKLLAQTPLFLVIEGKPSSHIKLVAAPLQDSKPLLFGLSPLIQEIESELLK